MQGQGADRSSGDATAMHEEIARYRDRIAEICRSHDVARLEIFGSAARGTDFDPVASLVRDPAHLADNPAMLPEGTRLNIQDRHWTT